MFSCNLPDTYTLLHIYIHYILPPNQYVELNILYIYIYYICTNNLTGHFHSYHYRCLYLALALLQDHCTPDVW